MAQILSCPDNQHLKEIALGQLSEFEGESLIKHIEGCSNCATRLSSILAEDTLVEAVRSKETVERSQEKDVVSRLIEKMRALVPATKGRDEQTQNLASSTPSPVLSGDTNEFSWADSSAASERGDDGLAPPQAPDEIGRLGPYRVLKVIGEGGMGKVFLADDPKLQRSVALKVMKPSLARDLDARQRFLQEARLAAAIEHDHIVHIYQVGEDRGMPFFAMQLLKGESLEDSLVRSAPLKIKEVLHIGMQIAEGLTAAHERGLIHRDIKPGNIWIESTGAGRVKILDFGLARSSAGDTGITQLGAVLGTPAYMPPEQARGDKVDHRCDIYSLGCILYRMATGELPLKGRHTMGMLTALAVDEPVAPIKLNAAIPHGLSDLIMKMLAKDPDQRVGSAKEVARMLARIERGDVPAAGDTAPMLPPPSVPKVESKTVDLYPTVAASKQSPTSVPAAPFRRNVFRRGLVAVLGTAAVLAFIGVLFNGPIVRIVTNKGVLVVEADDKSIEVRIKGEQVTIVDAKSKREFTLTAGEDQEIEVREMPDGVVVATRTFRLERNGREVVNARIEIAKVPAVPPPAKGAELAKAGPVDDAWIKMVATLPAKKQAEAVVAKLRELNPRLSGEAVHPAFDGKVVTGLTFTHLEVTDLSPVRALTGLQFLTFNNPERSSPGPLADLSPLKELNLSEVDITNTKVHDLSPLKGMKLTVFRCGQTRVSDLLPLKGMKLTYLSCGQTQVADLSPLKDMPLTYLDCLSSRVSDLSPLRNMKLTMLDCSYTQVSDLSPLKDMPLTGLHIYETKVSDLSPLKGMPLKALSFGNTQVADLAPLGDMQIADLDCRNTKVSNLSPLKGMKLRLLNCRNTRVSDLAPLKGMKLTILHCDNTLVSDLSPLRGMPLQELRCDFKAERDAEILRSIKTLKEINGKPAQQFWKEVAGQK